MDYGDFSSLVQLGVGLHVGTALLQLYGEIGVQPLNRSITRIKGIVDDATEAGRRQIDQLSKVETDFEIFRIRLFNEYKRYVAINFSFAVVLTVVLILISYNVDAVISVELSIILVAFSVLPGPITVGVLWFEASKEIKPLKRRADQLEREVLSSPTKG